MYLNPRNFERRFLVESMTTTVNEDGRKVRMYLPKGEGIWGILSNASTWEKMQWNQLKHPITHTVVESGAGGADVGDRLILGSRVFYVQGKDDASDLDWFTIYKVEERGRNDV